MSERKLSRAAGGKNARGIGRWRKGGKEERTEGERGKEAPLDTLGLFEALLESLKPSEPFLGPTEGI